MADELPAGSAVDPAGFVITVINSRYSRQINDEVHPEVLPDRRGRKNPRPVLRGGVPVDGVDMEERQDPVQDTVVGRQQAVDDVADDDPGQEMREQNRGLSHPREPAAPELVEQNGQRHGCERANDDKEKIELQGVEGDLPSPGRREEELEIVKADPGGIEESRFEVEFLKRNEHVRKREITEDQRIDGSRYDEQVGGSVRADFAQEAEAAFFHK